jgi:hypothetical protein
MKYIDENRATRFDFEIKVKNRSAYAQFHPHEVFLISFHGFGIFFRWIIANMGAILKVLLGFDKYHYIPMNHIESVGLEIEYSNQKYDCTWYMINYENGRKFRRAGTVIDIRFENYINGYLEINEEDGSYWLTFPYHASISRDFEHTHTLIQIWQNEDLLSDFKTDLNLN